MSLINANMNVTNTVDTINSARINAMTFITPDLFVGLMTISPPLIQL